MFGLSRQLVNAVLEGMDWVCSTCQTKDQRDFEDRVGLQMLISEKVEEGQRHQGLRILQWNVDGVVPKITELADRLQKDNIDIATIQEMKLRSGTATPRIQGYKSIRADRPGGVIGGGLLIYIRDSVVFQRGSPRRRS